MMYRCDQYLDPIAGRPDIERMIGAAEIGTFGKARHGDPLNRADALFTAAGRALERAIADTRREESAFIEKWGRHP